MVLRLLKMFVQAVNRPDFPTPALDKTGRFKWLWVSPLIHHAQIAYVSTSAAVATVLSQRRVLLFSIIIWQ